MADIDKAFEQLKREGKNNVDNIIKWFKDAKVLNDKITEEQVKKLLRTKDESKVELKQFKECLEQMATQMTIQVEQLQKNLMDENDKFYNAIKAGLQAFQKTLDEGKRSK